MMHTEFKQGTDEWKQYRCGKVTASRCVDVLPGVKGSYLAGRKNYMSEKICEILTGTWQESYYSAEMQRGIDLEEIARAEYEMRTGLLVETVGFVDHPKIKDFGDSPDGLIPEGKGLIEIKCPNTATHLDYMLNGNIDRRYIIQMNVGMLCNKSLWCDFISFDDRLPEDLQLYVKRVYPDKTLQQQIELEVIKFQAELNVMLDKIKTYRGAK